MPQVQREARVPVGDGDGAEATAEGADCEPVGAVGEVGGERVGLGRERDEAVLVAPALVIREVGAVRPERRLGPRALGEGPGALRQGREVLRGADHAAGGGHEHVRARWHGHPRSGDHQRAPGRRSADRVGVLHVGSGQEAGRRAPRASAPDHSVAIHKPHPGTGFRGGLGHVGH